MPKEKKAQPTPASILRKVELGKSIKKWGFTITRIPGGWVYENDKGGICFVGTQELGRI